MKFLIPFILSLALVSCGGSGLLDSSKHQENMAKLDKIYGPCDNPAKILLPKQKKLCEAKARAAGPDGVIGEGINLTDLISRKQTPTIISSSVVNKDLWNASLKILDPYTIKNIDFEGGFIQTDWIYNADSPNERCLIKSHVTSIELVSTGVNVKIICENLSNDIWYPSEKNLLTEEKNLTLKILEESYRLNQEQS